MGRCPLGMKAAIVLALCAGSATMLSTTLATATQVEIITRGTASPALVREAAEAVRYSSASLAGLGAALDPSPKVFLAGTKSHCEDIHVELGWTRSDGKRRCSLFSGITFLGAFVLNLQYIGERHTDPVGFMWWVVPHEMFHMYQWQSRIDRVGMPWAFWEGPADLHMFKVLDERRIIRMEDYVRTRLVPRAKAARARWNMSIVTRAALTAQNIDAHYDVSSVLGYHMYLNGGWPKIIALNGPGGMPFAERLLAIYGRTPEEFEREFFAWLDPL